MPKLTDQQVIDKVDAMSPEVIESYKMCYDAMSEMDRKKITNTLRLKMSLNLINRALSLINDNCSFVSGDTQDPSLSSLWTDTATNDLYLTDRLEEDLQGSDTMMTLVYESGQSYDSIITNITTGADALKLSIEKFTDVGEDTNGDDNRIIEEVLSRP